jgi:hypothetical protein
MRSRSRKDHVLGTQFFSRTQVAERFLAYTIWVSISECPLTGDEHPWRFRFPLVEPSLYESGFQGNPRRP